MTIIDSCIVMDLADPSRPNHTKSATAVGGRLRIGRLFAPDIVFAEVSSGYSSAVETRQLFDLLKIEVVPLSDEALFLAARTFRSQAGNNLGNTPDSAKRILPDFYVGAFAQTEGIPLLTRDMNRNWGKHFPSLKLITP